MTTAGRPLSLADAPKENLWRQALWILAASTLLRLLLAAIVPLFPDEAYYWEWSRRLAGGYFDHPPAIALLIAGGTALLGDTPLGVRLLPILAGTFAGYWLVRAACHLAGHRAARYTALTFAVLPLAAGGLVLATPDAPLLAGIAWTLYAVVRALDAGHADEAGNALDAGNSDDARRSTAYWLIAGVAIGCAMASKFTGVLIPVAIVLAMVAYAPLRARLAQPGPWLAVAVASLVMVPVLWWNAQHDWIAFRFQLGHGLGVTTRGSWFGRELELIGGQMGLVTPILCVLLLGATWRALRSRGRDPVRFTLAVVAAFCLLFFMYSATRKSVEANWPAIAWLPAILLLGAAREGLRTAWERRALWLAGALTAAALVHVVVPIFPLPARRDQVSKAHGWERLAAAVDEARMAHTEASGPADSSRLVYSDAGGNNEAPFLATNRYQDAAMLAFHLDGHPVLYSLNLGARRNQYDLWPRFRDRAVPGASLLLVLEEPATGVPGPIQRLAGHFASIEPGELVRLTRESPTRGEEYVGRRRLWRLDGWAGTWPADTLEPVASLNKTKPR